MHITPLLPFSVRNSMFVNLRVLEMGLHVFTFSNGEVKVTFTRPFHILKVTFCNGNVSIWKGLVMSCKDDLL